MAEDSAVVERGVVTAPPEVWALAVRRGLGIPEAHLPDHVQLGRTAYLKL